MTEQIAARDWHTRAVVRILQEKTCRSVDPYTVHTFHAGDEREMIQWGRAGRPVERDAWWTSFDIDGAYIVEASIVEVVKVLDEISPQEESNPAPGVGTTIDGLYWNPDKQPNHSDSSESAWWNPDLP